jgi:hypothetical protein
MKSCAVGQIGESDQGPDTGHVNYICVFIVAPDYDHFLSRKRLGLPLIIQLVIPFRLTVGEHELRAVGLYARENAVFRGFDYVDMVSFRTDAIANLTGENFEVSTRNAGGVLSSEANTQHQ